MKKKWGDFMELVNIIERARGEKEADLLLKNGKMIGGNVQK